ncbi:MAG: DNA translocase FtsK [Thermoleophilaceae bacterium]
MPRTSRPLRSTARADTRTSSEGEDGVAGDDEPAADAFDDDPEPGGEDAPDETFTDPGAVARAERRPPAPEDLTPMGRLRSSVTEAEGFEWPLPSSNLLERSRAAAKPDTKAEQRTGGQLVEALSHFGVDAEVVGTVAGPHVTRHELRLSPGTKMSKVSQLKDDIAYALAATDVRILAPIPGKRAVGVEVPNLVRRTVHLGDVFQDPPSGWSPLSVWLGKDIAGKAIGTDIAKQPHLLVAGTTGSGKSGSVNAMLASILLRASPNEVRLVLVDPKQVELGLYESIPHLLTPVVTNPRAAANVLANLIREMEQRYGIMSLARTRNLVELNKHRESRGERPLPYILCVIDELADLMMVAPGEVEDAIIRLAQKSRAVGIHLLLATQRPSADIITGMIKANVPARIAFAVSSQTDSRVILDQNGAESLLGQGDMLFRPASESRSGSDPGRVRQRGGDRAHHRLLALPGRARDAGGAARGRRGRPGVGGRERVQRRRRRPPRGGHRHGGPDGVGVDLDAPAPPARGLHARGAADRHDGAPRGDLRLRGLEGPSGARLRSRAPARAGRSRGAGRSGLRHRRLRHRSRPAPPVGGRAGRASAPG